MTRASEIYELRARLIAAHEALLAGDLADVDAILDDLEKDVAKAERKESGDA